MLNANTASKARPLEYFTVNKIIVITTTTIIIIIIKIITTTIIMTK